MKQEVDSDGQATAGVLKQWSKGIERVLEADKEQYCYKTFLIVIFTESGYSLFVWHKT